MAVFTPTTRRHGVATATVIPFASSAIEARVSRSLRHLAEGSPYLTPDERRRVLRICDAAGGRF